MKNILVSGLLLVLCVTTTACSNRTLFTPVVVVVADHNNYVSPEQPFLIVRDHLQFLVCSDKLSQFSKLFNWMSLILPFAQASNPTAIPLSTTLASNTTMTVDSSALVAPPNITSDVLSFGSLTITNLKDNNVKQCGTNSNQRCGHAYIIIYTSSAVGAGLYNSVDGYGAPINAGTGTTLVNVGLGLANGATVQTYVIPGNKNVIRNTDFSSQPMTYNVQVDFSNAGAGSYSTVLDIVYALGN